MQHGADFQRILSSPTEAYEEGLRFFMGKGLLNNALRRIASDLEAHGIDYSVIGAIALNQHGYHRFTEDIDLLLTKEGLERFRGELIGLGYVPAFEGSTKKFRMTAENVPIDIITSGEYPGDGLPKPVKFPDPAESFVVIDGVKTLRLEKLIELKLASGMTAPDRLKDLADVQEMIKAKSLGSSFAERLDPSVRDKFLELYHLDLEISAVVSPRSDVARTEISAKADPFEGCKAIPGLEQLGRVILDENGCLSGSPANYENLRGSSDSKLFKLLEDYLEFVRTRE